MKSKLLNILLIISSLIGYLEWGGTNYSFLFQVEFEIFSKLLTSPISVLHPLTFLPMLGQALLIFTLFQKRPSKLLTYIGIGGIGVLLVFMLVIGLMSFNIKIIFSTIPFIVLALLAIRHYRKVL